MKEEMTMYSTSALTVYEGEQRYGLSLAPHTAFPAGAGTWSPCANFPILVNWLPADTLSVRLNPPQVTAEERIGEPLRLPPAQDVEQQGWLKVAESAFAFWDNPSDDGWDRL